MKTLRIVIGIDPGLTGAVAVINERGGFIAVSDTPTMKVAKSNGGKRNTYLAADMYRLLTGITSVYDVACAAIEYQASRPGQGAPATFSQGYGYGLWTMALAAAGVPYEIVQPRKWKADMRIPTGADKSASVLMATQLFPHAPLRTERGRELDGRSEALLLAEHLRRKLVKQ